MGNWTKTVAQRLPLLVMLFLLGGVFLAAPDSAHAAQGTTSLQWEAPLQKFADSLKGPVAFSISLLGVVVCGAMLVFGGEINEFARRGIMLVLAVATLAFATGLLTSLFNYGALV